MNVANTLKTRTIERLRKLYRTQRKGAFYWSGSKAALIMLELADEAFFGRWRWPVIAPDDEYYGRSLDAALQRSAGTPMVLVPRLTLASALARAAPAADFPIVLYAPPRPPPADRDGLERAGCRLISALPRWTETDVARWQPQDSTSTLHEPAGMELERRLLERLAALGYF